MLPALRIPPAAARFAVRDLQTTIDLPGQAATTIVHGRLAGNPDAAPVIVLGGVSADRRVLSDEHGPGWWPGVAARGGALDPDHVQILSMDFLGSASGEPARLQDQASAALALADAAGIEQFSIIGASFGGTVALEIAARAPQRVTGLDLLCAAAGIHPMAQAWRSIQREILELALDAGLGARGVDIARRLAMTTYRTPEEFAQRFGPAGPDDRCDRGVEGYLQARGSDYARTVSPERYLSRLDAMQAPAGGLERICAPTRLLAIRSDRLVPPAEIHATAQALTAVRAEVIEIDSLYGHDGFLKDAGPVNEFLKDRS
ncbi:alpha/beta fold hydrolase [Maricaulis sp.]|uniref:alpha/beta fold hydrolase n=1 Tax=Maricaulis sp. TaxID=1486257 RepID=UPI002626670E|nr:alpha/beta fold hydrolase [Maricaulis sp.]